MVKKPKRNIDSLRYQQSAVLPVSTNAVLKQFCEKYGVSQSKCVERIIEMFFEKEDEGIDK